MKIYPKTKIGRSMSNVKRAGEINFGKRATVYARESLPKKKITKTNIPRFCFFPHLLRYQQINGRIDFPRRVEFFNIGCACMERA